jgi:hypothetical protein
MIEEQVASALLRRFEFFARAGLFRAVWRSQLKTNLPEEFQAYVKRL